MKTKGRGATGNPTGRFNRLTIEDDLDYRNQVAAEDTPKLKTEFYHDTSQSIISYNDSPDTGFSCSINPYRGCEHGCIYCYARPTHEYFGWSAGMDFESKIMVKKDAGKLLRQELSNERYKPQPLGISGVTDAYQPIERKLRITRECLEILAECRHPAGIITKNHLVTRDIDLLSELAQYQAARVMLSITSLDFELSRTMEPRTSIPEKRLEAIRQLTAAGVPAGVMIAPVIPGLNDHEIPKILEAAADAGAIAARYVVLRLPYGLKDLFSDWVEKHYPDRCEKVFNRIREVRGGQLNDAHFNTRMKGQGIFADQINSLFQIGCRRNNIATGELDELKTAHFRRPPGPQLMLF
jgi:DNA repair photolyase